MSIYKQFKGFAEKLIIGNDDENVYREMIPIFADAQLYQEQAGLLEKLFNITNNPSLYLEIGDLMYEKLNNREVAKITYNKYLSLTQPEFYKKYIAITDPTFQLTDDSDFDQGLLNLTDKFCAIVYMVVYLYQTKQLQEVLEFANYLTKVESYIEAYIQENNVQNLAVLGDVTNCKVHLASLLVQTGHHNDINKLAIKLDPTNEAGYLNVIDDLVVYDNFEQALVFYNDTYCKAFSQNNSIHSAIDLCWFLSDKYSAIGEFYNSVCRQKKAIDLELCGVSHAG